MSTSPPPAAAPAPSALSAAAGVPAIAAPTLLSRKFIVVAGKGGVGRTTVAAALARVAQQAGKRVLLAQMESSDRLTRLLGAARPIGADVVDLGGGLSAVNMTPQRALHEYGLMVLRYETLTRAVFENRAARGFLRAIPGLDAYAMLGKAWWHTTETSGGRPRYDLVIVDGPASGHAVRMLTIPKAILEALPKGPLARDAAAMAALITDPTLAAMLIVTLPEELPARETALLARDATTQLGMPLAPLVVNGVPSATFDDPALLHVLGSPLEPGAPAPLRHTLAGLRVLAERRHDANLVLARLAREPGLPMIELPRLPETDLGPDELVVLSTTLAAGLAR
jgi:anion-transporting  ArsA/GET3 family ATPase